MFNRRTLAIVKRELRELVLTKNFVISTLLVPVVSFMTLGIQLLFILYDSETKVRLAIVEESAMFNKQLQQELEALDYVADGQYHIEYYTIPRNEFPSFLDSVNNELTSNRLNGIIYIPASVKTKKRLEFYSASASGLDLNIRLGSVLNEVFVREYFSHKDITDDDLQYAKQFVTFQFNRVSEEGIAEEGWSAKALALGFTFLLFLSVSTMGNQILVSVHQEKTTRIVEIILSSATSYELIASKVVGSTLTGLLQMTIWMLPGIVVAFAGTVSLGSFLNIELQFSLNHFFYFFLNYTIALVTHLCLFAAIGAIVRSLEDSIKYSGPISLLLMLPFLLAFTMARNPANRLAEIASMLPFASLVVMPARVTLLNVPSWQIGLAIFVNLAVLYFVMRAVGKIYRVGILITGKRPTWREVYGWLKYE